MRDIQRILGAISRGTDRGITHAGQLQELFAQKDQMERQKKQDEFNRTKAQLDTFTDWLSSDIPSLRTQAAAGLRDMTAKNKELFGGTVDLTGVINKKEDDEEFQGLITEIRELRKRWSSKGHGNLTEQAYSSALRDVSMKLAKYDTTYAEGLRKNLDSQIEGIDKKILAAQKQNYELAQIEARGTSEKQSALAQKIQTTMEAYPSLSEQEATGVAAGYIAINTNPITGESVLVNKVTGTSKDITPLQTQENKPAEQPEQRKTKTLWELTDLSTGVLSGIRTGASKISGQVGLRIAEKTIYARQRFASAQNNLIRSLSINPRYPVAEMKRIKEETSIEPQLLDSPPALRTRMRAVKDYLEAEIKANERVASNNKMPIDQRKEAIRSIEAMNSFINEMGIPEETSSALTKEDQALLDKYK